MCAQPPWSYRIRRRRELSGRTCTSKASHMFLPAPPTYSRHIRETHTHMHITHTMHSNVSACMLCITVRNTLKHIQETHTHTHITEGFGSHVLHYSQEKVIILNVHDDTHVFLVCLALQSGASFILHITMRIARCAAAAAAVCYTLLGAVHAQGMFLCVFYWCR